MANALRIPVLQYHRVGSASCRWEQRFCISPQRFSAHMEALRKAGIHPVTAEEYVGWIQGRETLPERSVLITFDDGYLDVFLHAAPVLRELGWPATLFLVSRRLGMTDTWDSGKNPSGRAHRLMDVSHVRELVAGGWSAHVHSRSHVSLLDLGPRQLQDEVAGAKADLEALGLRPRFLSYPYGQVNEAAELAVRSAGFEAAFQSGPGFSEPASNPYTISRVEVFGSDTPRLLMRKIAFAARGDGRLSRLWFSVNSVAGRLLFARMMSHAHWHYSGSGR